MIFSDYHNAKYEGCEKFYDCCLGELGTKGCKGVCKKCGKLWGTQAGTCFKGGHDLVEMIEDN